MKLGSDILWLSESDVASLLTMQDALPTVEAAFRLHGQGEAQLPSKIYLTFEPFDGDLRAMPAYLKGDVSAAGVKIVNSNASNPAKGLPAVTGILVYVDPQTGLPLGVFGAGTLTAVRTGAAGGIAAKYLANKNSSVVGLIGCGRQAQTQLDALLAYFKIKKVLVWGKTVPESNAFCKANAALKIEFVSTADLKAVCQADILVTTTPSKTPVVKKEWVKPGAHINAIGSYTHEMQEVDCVTLRRASKLVVDQREAALAEAGDLIIAIERGEIQASDIYAELGEIAAGLKSGRETDDEITYFKSVGNAAQDAAVAWAVYQRARKEKLGVEFDLLG